MKAIQFNATIPRYALGRALGKIFPPILWSGAACVQYRDVPEPQLINAEWVIVKTRYGGICGSDHHLLHLHNAPSSSALTSFPFTIGHENVGTIARVGARVRDFSIGARVVVEPTLGCKPRGFSDLCRFCARGETQLCERVTRGALAAGLITGACRDTGGSWSEYFLAHESQLVRVPANVNDENALMLEPFATSLHAVLQNLPRDDETVLILGAGVIGLCALAALRAVGSRARIIVMARHAVQQEMARAYGADIVIATSGNDYYAEFARAVGGELRQPIIGKRVLVGGGAEIVFECVGNSGTIDDALRCVRARGRVVMLGLAALPSGVDWTPIWLRELNVIGTYTYGVDEFRGERARTFDLALDFIKQGKVNLTSLVTHKFALKDYARAFETIRARGKNRALKVAFEFA